MMRALAVVFVTSAALSGVVVALQVVDSDSPEPTSNIEQPDAVPVPYPAHNPAPKDQGQGDPVG